MRIANICLFLSRTDVSFMLHVQRLIPFHLYVLRFHRPRENKRDKKGRTILEKYI